MIAILYFKHMPSIGFKALSYVFCERVANVSINGDVVGIIQGDQFAKLPVSKEVYDQSLHIPHTRLHYLPCKRDSLSCHTFLKTSITKDGVGVVIKDWVIRAVVVGSQMSFSSSKTHSIGDAYIDDESHLLSLYIYMYVP